MTEFTFWKIGNVSFSSCKCCFFSRILSLPLRGVANLVRCKHGASKKKYVETLPGREENTKKKRANNEYRAQMIDEHLDLQLYLEEDLPLTF